MLMESMPERRRVTSAARFCPLPTSSGLAGSGPEGASAVSASSFVEMLVRLPAADTQQTLRRYLAVLFERGMQVILQTVWMPGLVN